MTYLNKRGGRIILQDIKNPDTQFEMSAVEAMTKALELEKLVNEVMKILTGLKEQGGKCVITDDLLNRLENVLSQIWQMTCGTDEFFTCWIYATGHLSFR